MNSAERALSVVDSFFYWFVAASIAELASAIPSSGTGLFATGDVFSKLSLFTICSIC